MNDELECFDCFHWHLELIDKSGPLGNGKEFFFSIAVIGEISMGKSTFINSIFGDVLSEAGFNGTTMIPHRFYESPEVKSNDQMWFYNQSKNANILGKEDWQLQQQELHKNIFAKTWTFMTSRSPEFRHFPTYKVKISDIIPQPGTSFSF